jgi:hypothetical protein
MKAYGGVTSALVRGEWSTSRPGRFTPGERAPGTLWIGGWVDPRTGLDDGEKRQFLSLSGLELRPLDRPARSQSLYQLRYPGSVLFIIDCVILYFISNIACLFLFFCTGYAIASSKTVWGA